jgi:two-component system, OmpR family, phosphate regulon sensor histidine kinase PhoR
VDDTVAASTPVDRRPRRDLALVAERRTRLALGTLLMLLLALAGIAVLSSGRLYRSSEDQYVKEAIPLRSNARDIVLQMVNEETAVRGYLITGRRDSLGPYERARPAVAADLATLDRLAKRRPEIGGNVDAARSFVADLERYFAQQVALADRGPAGRRRAQENVLDGKLKFDQFRFAAERLLTRSDEILLAAERSQRNTFRNTLGLVLAVSGIAGAIGLALLMFVPERMRRLYAREQAAREAAERGDRASHALEHVQASVVLLDNSDRILYWNRAAELLFGVPEAEAVRHTAPELMPELGTIEEALARGGSGEVVPIVIDEEERWLAVSETRLTEGRVLVLRDVTAEQQLERARGEFIATASHELRTPLAAVYGAVRTLRRADRPVDGELDEQLLTMIETESARLKELIEQILVSAEVDRGEVRLTREPCDLRALCENATEAVSVHARAHTFSVDGPGSVLVECDPSRLRQVVMNLLDNAVKYSPDGGNIEVRVRERPTGASIEVSDEGIGVPADAQAQIFEKFARLDAGMLRGVGGSGLGLYISRELVERMGGHMSVRSQPGVGSTFVVELPRVASPVV